MMAIFKQIFGYSDAPVDPRSIPLPLIQTYEEWLLENPDGYVC
jgi:hypothetical protein